MAKPATPNRFYVQQGNNQAYLSWDISVGSTSYNVQRSTDGVNFSSIATPSVNNYRDTSVTLGTQYFYKVAAVNVDGTSPYTVAQSVVPTANGEMSLGELRTQAQLRADRLNSDFVTLPEWNANINNSMLELYDLLVTVYEDYFKAPAIHFVTAGAQFKYELPNGSNTFLDDSNNTITPPALYKLLGVDLGLQTAQNAYVTVNKFNFIDRNRFIYPNTASAIYGVFNLQYRMMDKYIEFIPTPSASQVIRLHYIPRLPKLLADNDLTTIGMSGWLEYVITDAAIKALQKEEADVSVLMQQKAALIKRIEDSAMNRDAGQPDKISDIRGQGWFGSGTNGYGYNGPVGGF